MDLLQRIQRWYTINCNGDWEHEYVISITNVDNPGWWVTIDLQDTCLEKAVLHKTPTIKRSTTDWVLWYVEDYKFIASGGSENLSEIMGYFLDEFLPANIDPDCMIEIHLPIMGYEGKLWLKAEARMLSESTLEVVFIEDGTQAQSYEWGNDSSMNLLDKLTNADLLPDLSTHYKVGDSVEPVLFEAEDNMLRTFLIAPVSK